MACTCLGGDNDLCGFCDWNETLTDAELGAYALEFVHSLTTVTGVMRGEPERRDPWLGQTATVEFVGWVRFDDFLSARYAEALEQAEARMAA